VRGNVGRALAALTELRPPRGAELEGAAAVGRERAEQGLSIDGVVHAYRISISAVWTRFGELPRERGVDVTSVLAVLLGTIDAAGLSRESAGFGLDPSANTSPSAPARWRAGAPRPARRRRSPGHRARS
jgi:hypothetical protein